MEQAAPDKMKVAELRAALQERGLDTKGTKPVLVARLQEAFDAEKPAEEEVPAAAAEEKMETEAGAAEEPAKAESMETGEAAAKTEETPAEGKPAENKTEAKVEKKEEEKGTKRKADEEPPFEVKENEPEIPEALVCLDWYNSDLNLRITDNYMTGIPFSRDGWGYCYAGARATYGFNSGKVWFEVKYLDNLDVKVEKDAVTFDLRVGWSSNKGSLMLGEDDKSWCYSSAEGKMAHMKTFEEYGEKFTKGDVVGAYIDFEGDEVSLTFTKNGEDQGDAFQIPKAELNGEALFPHIMARNVKFDVNFGLDKEDKVVEDLKEKLDGAYIKAGSVPIDQRVRGSARIATREECELVMMVGLPASGKTTWVEKHVADNAEKQYNVISTTTMINKMTVNGEPRKKHHTGKWELVVQKATRSLQEMLRAASQRRRNVIIDQVGAQILDVNCSLSSFNNLCT
jgi:heterogeneous nuclear ribonucleoprotein U-like protein 1